MVQSKIRKRHDSRSLKKDNRVLMTQSGIPATIVPPARDAPAGSNRPRDSGGAADAPASALHAGRPIGYAAPAVRRGESHA
jgi:hypothetical protein